MRIIIILNKQNHKSKQI